MAEIFVSVQAYAKLVLHAAKYPQCAVNGVLLAEENKSKDKRSVRFVDCIPLFHLSLSLAPMLEAALLQIEAYCKSNGYVIGGYYQANECISDKGINSVASHIGKKIQEQFPDACLFMIDNTLVSDDTKSEVYKVYSVKDAHWKEYDKRHTIEEDTLSVASALLRQSSQRQLIDFDNHLDDVKKDWRNLAINDIIDHCT